MIAYVGQCPTNYFQTIAAAHPQPNGLEYPRSKKKTTMATCLQFVVSTAILKYFFMLTIYNSLTGKMT